MTAPGRATPRKSTITLDMSSGEGDFFAELLTESAERLAAASEQSNSSRMNAAMVRFLHGKAQQIREQLPSDSGGR